MFVGWVFAEAVDEVLVPAEKFEDELELVFG